MNKNWVKNDLTAPCPFSSSSLPPPPSHITHFLSPEYFSDVSGVQFFCFFVSSVSSLLVRRLRLHCSAQDNDRTVLMSLSCKYPTFKNKIGRQIACATFAAIHFNMVNSLKSSRPKLVGAGYIPPWSLISVGLVLPRVYQNSQWLSLLEWWCRHPDRAVVFSGLG